MENKQEGENIYKFMEGKLLDELFLFEFLYERAKHLVKSYRPNPSSVRPS